MEAFVEKHYMEQIVPLNKSGEFPALVTLLSRCCDDEVHHKDEAHALHQQLATHDCLPLDLVSNAWGQLVTMGSQLAVAVCRRI